MRMEERDYRERFEIDHLRGGVEQGYAEDSLFDSVEQDSVFD
jgi:hypothetical protein